MGWTDAAEGLLELDDAALAKLDALTPMDAAAGTVLFRPGDSVKGFVIMLSGRVEVFLTGPTGREILLYAVEPGQSCIQSTLGLLGGEEYSGEAVTRRPARLVLVPRDVFLSLMDGSPAFRSFVFAAFATRMQSMMHLLERVAFQKIENRLAEALLSRAEDGLLTATHAELAVMIGTAREVVSRRLDAFARRGLVELRRGTVRLRDPDTLRSLAAEDG
ncbi:Crp/Fnr family transcriptional regulator [Primorskyibacter aestuariivivens]|uniref:Crp/Fnr family transcriptional regulator n=1 Tax=Primorskyibacter aestuariivivens TaxID=1888912 RepID=UPI0022FFF721|nr:Crp/Fnr family transcriptional regulator [Primorskyibacter aestuariivivens]MDA7426875.1 Crp/Fnr family transcriptional regulator [Primorskyibacter aestuariivivens]